MSNPWSVACDRERVEIGPEGIGGIPATPGTAFWLAESFIEATSKPSLNEADHAT